MLEVERAYSSYDLRPGLFLGVEVVFKSEIKSSESYESQMELMSSFWKSSSLISKPHCVVFEVQP